jgi:hypothetical protein
MDDDFLRIHQPAAGDTVLRWAVIGAVIALGGFALWRLVGKPVSAESSSGKDPVDLSSEDSFPASDPPAFNARGPSQ